MSLDRLDKVLDLEVKNLQDEGRAKPIERVINKYIPPKSNKGARYSIEGYSQEFIRMNSNNYLGLSNHKKVVDAAHKATEEFGVGPGAVRFIDGTFKYHVDLEDSIAKFVNKPSAKIFNSAYTSNLALSLTISSKDAFWIGDELNHNSIIRSMRISNVPRSNRSIYKHNDIDSLKNCLENIPSGIKRVYVIFDGIFSMRGDYAFLDRIRELTNSYQDKFEQGVILIIDDSHGIAAYGDTGRGTCEYTDTNADIIVGTFGKGIGVNGGFIAGSKSLTEAIRQKADTYIYTNPLSVADCAASMTSIDILDSQEGKNILSKLKNLTSQFREGIKSLGYETIEGVHPVVPILVRDTNRTHSLVKSLFNEGILMVGLTFPVVPKGYETIRVQMNADLTESDIEEVFNILKKFN